MPPFDDKPPPTLAAFVREQAGVPWSRARRLCEEGRDTFDGVRCLDPAARVKPGAAVVVSEHGPKRRRGLLPGDAIVHADRDLVVIDKPAGTLSVADEASNRDTLADHARTELRSRGKRDRDAPLGVVHRLDRDTSGLMMFARTSEAKRVLAAMFKAHDIERVYLAIAHGTVNAARVDTHLARKLAFAHPRTGAALSFERDPPEDFEGMRRLLQVRDPSIAPRGAAPA